MARVLNSDQIIDLINSEARSLGFFIIEVNERHSGYSICAGIEVEASGHTATLIFRRDIFHVSRLYSREDVADTVKVLTTIRDNIVKGGVFTPKR